MVNLQDAINKATDYAKFMNKDNPILNIRVEEIDANGSNWFLTLGWDDKFYDDSGIFTKTKRIYKVFTIKKSDGEVIGVSMRE